MLNANAEWISFAVGIFLVQIALNAAWSWVFFSLHSPRGGLVIIAFLWLAIFLTIVAFWHIDRAAPMLLWPYLLWVSFAAALNWKSTGSTDATGRFAERRMATVEVNDTMQRG